MRPVVGITAMSLAGVSSIAREMPYAALNEGLAQLTEEAGGVPIVLTPVGEIDELLARLDALVLSGGGDVEPELYGVEPHPQTTWLDRRRDEFELALVAAARRRRLPLLGVCRGIQLVNVALGGTLVQHLADVTEIDHEARERWDATAHEIRVDPDSRLAAVLGGTRIEVNSVHHQGLDRLGDGLLAVAWAPDGVVEAIESSSERILAVQWHPEWAGKVDWKRQRRLFEDLVAPTGENSARPA